MADQTINVPPPGGAISLNVGDTLTIDVGNEDILFCCSIGGNFNPSIASIHLSKNSSTSYTAETAGTGTYNTSKKDETCNPSGGTTATAKSVQISG
jgi:hypothetical protein